MSRAVDQGLIRFPGEGVAGMEAALVFHRLQFAFTLVYHYLFPQLTMGLALLIVIMKALGLREGGERWNDAARFWIRIFGLNFAFTVFPYTPLYRLVGVPSPAPNTGRHPGRQP